MRPVVEELGPQFERVTGDALAITFATLGEIVRSIQDGETADVVVVPRQGIDHLVKEGKAATDGVTVIARSGIGAAVRAGAPKPDISTPGALKHTLLAAKSIAFSDPANGGASGKHFTQVLERLEIASRIKPKVVLAAPGIETGVLVANGNAEIGIHQFQVLVSVPGIEMVGPLPGGFQLKLSVSASGRLPTFPLVFQTLASFNERGGRHGTTRACISVPRALE